MTELEKALAILKELNGQILLFEANMKRAFGESEEDEYEEDEDENRKKNDICNILF